MIQETIRESLPEGFQTAEYLRDHGMVDLVVPRGELRSQLATLINLLMQKKIGKGVTREEDTSRLPVKQNGSARGKKDKAKS